VEVEMHFIIANLELGTATHWGDFAGPDEFLQDLLFDCLRRAVSILYGKLVKDDSFWLVTGERN
jgi:hypothetical protein